MAISLMSGYNNISVYYRIPEASAVTPQKIEAQQETVPGSTKSGNAAEEQPTGGQIQQSAAEESALQKRTSVNPSEISMTFHKEETFDYLGSESSLMNLDMQKAISDMKKDSILQDYQYFVGSTISVNPEDGMVIRK